MNDEVQGVHALAQAADAALPNGFTKRQIAAAITPKVQELILLPTEKCNFRCTYCYEDFEIGKMSEATQRSIELFLDKRIPNLQKLTLSWFGGEPLMAKDVVLRIAKYAQKLCREYGVFFEGGLTTNAYYLDAETADALLGANQNFFQVTFDGWKEAHDVIRRDIKGAGTFEKIWSNLERMRSLEDKFEVVIRIHVRRDNLENLRVMMRELARTFGNDQRYRLDFQHLRDMGGEGGKTVINPVSLDELSGIEAQLTSVYRQHVQEFHGVGTETAQALQGPELAVRLANESAGGRRSTDIDANAPYICYASRPNSLLIRANGRIGKCTVAFSDPRNDLGYLKDDGSIEIDNQRLQPWMRGIRTFDVVTAGCPMVGMPAEPPQQSDEPGRRIVPIAAV